MKIYKGLVILALFLNAATLAAPSIQEGKRLIQFTEEGPAVWLTMEEIDAAAAKHINFMDVTDLEPIEAIQSRAPPHLFDIPTTIRYPSSVAAAIARLNVSRIEEFIVPFTTYFNRYYTATTGVEASDWLAAQVQSFIINNGYSGISDVSQFTHTWAQKSIIAIIRGSDSSAGRVILGAHMDSINSGSSSGRAPGADDNASGSTTIFEAFKALLESGFRPRSTIEFHWYSAEEVGLRGSAAIAASYASGGVNVTAMNNFDMTGYESTNPSVAIISDYTDASLNAFIGLVVDNYCNIGWFYGPCGYACSDHASWNRNGFRAAMPHEGLPRSPYIHTTYDTLSNIKYDRVLEFSKLAIGYAIELAEPSNTQ